MKEELERFPPFSNQYGSGLSGQAIPANSSWKRARVSDKIYRAYNQQFHSTVYLAPSRPTISKKNSLRSSVHLLLRPISVDARTDPLPIRKKTTPISAYKFDQCPIENNGLFNFRAMTFRAKMQRVNAFWSEGEAKRERWKPREKEGTKEGRKEGRGEPRGSIVKEIRGEKRTRWHALAVISY